MIIDIHGHYTTAPAGPRPVAGPPDRRIDRPGFGAASFGVEDFRRRAAGKHRAEPIAAHG